MKRIGLTLLLAAAMCGAAGILYLFIDYCSRHPWALLGFIPLAIAGPCYGLAGALLRKDAEEASK